MNALAGASEEGVNLRERKTLDGSCEVTWTRADSSKGGGREGVCEVWGGK
jgi:hypothetical protein